MRERVVSAFHVSTFHYTYTYTHTHTHIHTVHLYEMHSMLQWNCKRTVCHVRGFVNVIVRNAHVHIQHVLHGMACNALT